MTTNSQYPTVDQAIGQATRALRQQYGLRQDDLAATARDVGLDWTQATVTAIEHGVRSLAPAELFLLPLVLHQATGDAERFELTDLLPRNGRVILGREVVHVRALRAALNGELTNLFGPVLPRLVPSLSDAELTEYRRLWPDATPEGLALPFRWADGSAERKAARALSTTPRKVSVAARARYGRSLTAERDRRVAAQAPSGASARTLQALRGHVTRALLTELADHLDRPDQGGPDHG